MTRAAPLLEPKRRRGHLRVQAISDAAIALFAERGFDGTTMTEIAARSGTAIGSLYRFFPTKEQLADRLLAQYVENLDRVIDGVARDAPGLAPGDLVTALFAAVTRDDPGHAAITVLADARRGGPFDRAIIRASFHAALSRVLAAWRPTLDDAHRAVAAGILRQLLKGGLALREEEPGDRPGALTAPWHMIVSAYLGSLPAPA